MKAIELKDIPKIDNPHKVEVRKFHETENVQAVQITLLPGENLKKHTTAVDVFFYVLEGTGIVEIGNEKKQVIKDTYIDSPARIPHCWYNESKEILKILVVKTPKPNERPKM